MTDEDMMIRDAMFDILIVDDQFEDMEPEEYEEHDGREPEDWIGGCKLEWYDGKWVEVQL